MYRLYDSAGKELSYHNLQDKSFWCKEGESIEHAFVRIYGKQLGIEINPKKTEDKYAPDLIDMSSRLGDLKTQNTPMFSAERYGLDPTYTIVFNLKDAIRYERLYPNIDIYFWIKWIAVRYENYGKETTVHPIDGVWKISFKVLLSICKNAPVHSYMQRKNDDKGNAKESYVLDFRNELFVKVI